MPNCAIYEKGSDTITYFIHNCIQTGRDFRGSNGSVTGVKEALFDTKWTNDAARAGDAVSSISEALRYNSIPVSTPDDVDAITRDLIQSKYPSCEEAKLHRLRLSHQAVSGPSWEAWIKYQVFVEKTVQAGKDFKNKHFLNYKNNDSNNNDKNKEE